MMGLDPARGRSRDPLRSVTRGPDNATCAWPTCDLSHEQWSPGARSSVG
jgi:hypothetical protein